MPRWLLVQRRREARQRGSWDARYRMGAGSAWVACRLVDLARNGAAIELIDRSLPPQGRIDVDVRPGPEGVEGFVLAGEVRNVRRGPRGHHQVGVEFLDVSDVARHVLDDLLGLGPE
ncbi:MAG: PilZ domain-containing protein [Acidimicrobiia bacterium]